MTSVEVSGWHVQRVGWSGPPVELSPPLLTRLRRLIDVLIPGDDSFPSASDAGVAEEFLTHCLAEPAEGMPSFADPTGFIETLGRLDPVDTGSDVELQQLVRSLKLENPTFYNSLIVLTYYGYYSRPLVTDAIIGTVPGASRYNGTPQPDGHEVSRGAWSLPDQGDRRAYTPTDCVKRLSEEAR